MHLKYIKPGVFTLSKNFKNSIEESFEMKWTNGEILHSWFLSEKIIKDEKKANKIQTNTHLKEFYVLHMEDETKMNYGPCNGVCFSMMM